MANSQFDERDLVTEAYASQVSDGTTTVNIFTSGSNFRVDAIFVANLDSIVHVYSIKIFPQSEPSVPLINRSLPAVASGVASIEEALTAAFPAGKQFLAVKPGTTIQLQLAAAVTSDNLFTIVLLGGTI